MRTNRIKKFTPKMTKRMMQVDYATSKLLVMSIFLVQHSSLLDQLGARALTIFSRTLVQ